MSTINGKRLGSVFNNDTDGLWAAMVGTKSPVDDYRKGVRALLDMRPGVLAQNVGWPVVERSWSSSHVDARASCRSVISFVASNIESDAIASYLLDD